MLLVIVDAYSNRPKVIPMRTSTSSQTIDALSTVFTHDVLPTQVVSDKGPQITSEEFAKFTKENGINTLPLHRTTLVWRENVYSPSR